MMMKSFSAPKFQNTSNLLARHPTLSHKRPLKSFCQVPESENTPTTVETPAETPQIVTPTSTPTPTPTPVSAGEAAVQVAEPFALLNQTSEAINARAAMLGFVGIVIGEFTTGQSGWSQVAGKYVDERAVERALFVSDMGFFGIIVLLSFASLAPRLIAGEKPSDRSFGPFTPFLEMVIGRTAMLGVLGLVLVEFLQGNKAFFG
eukprot:TRINITY_DN27958_c0_g1_i1.p1 TRINITY_DN27958_c0_g1~~TRINITY_DN27958_c0_g1_i1.p1  ORF type:complete len:204 (-),score=48.46 TRINITY_DN27958_c0_g1_i1:373-984(-)